jgi:hypothetical protein
MTLRLSALLALLATAASPAVAQTPTATADPDLAARYGATITPSELAGLLYVYADDHLAGRATGEPGQRFAALWLAGQYQAMGVEPKGTGAAESPYHPAAYLQPFDLEGDVTARAALTASGTATAETVSGDAADGRSYLGFGDAQTVAAAPVVFGGFGVQTDRYDDVSRLADEDLAGRWLLLLGGDPAGPDGRSLATDDGETSRFGRNPLGKAASLLRRGNAQHGLAGVIVVAARDADVAAEAAKRAGRVGSIRLPSDETNTGGYVNPPVFVVAPSFADRVLAASGQSVAGLRAEASDGEFLDVFRVEGVRLAAEVEKETRAVPTENVAAFVEGSDPVLKDEAVVISAHLDHVGGREDADEDAIYNGADDDGSGTVAILEIAEAFQAATDAGHGPRRSVLFLHVTGEEAGLLGSTYYADREPLVPIENTVANLNIDMIGRYDPTRGFETTDYVYVIGGDLISQDLHDWNAAVNEATGTDLFLSDRFNSPDDPNQFFRRSDHWNFGKYDVPFIFYFTGTHEDYHGVGDEPEKIDYDRLARIARLIFGTAWEVANRDERPAVSGVGFN